MVTIYILLFSMSGIPPLFGFLVKFYVLLFLLETGNVIILIFSLFGSLVSTYYYLKIISQFLFEPFVFNHSVAQLFRINKVQSTTEKSFVKQNPPGFVCYLSAKYLFLHLVVSVVLSTGILFDLVALLPFNTLCATYFSE